jgi:hypothetical protein
MSASAGECAINEYDEKTVGEIIGVLVKGIKNSDPISVIKTTDAENQLNPSQIGDLISLLQGKLRQIETKIVNNSTYKQNQEIAEMASEEKNMKIQIIGEYSNNIANILNDESISHSTRVKIFEELSRYASESVRRDREKIYLQEEILLVNSIIASVLQNIYDHVREKTNIIKGAGALASILYLVAASPLRRFLTNPIFKPFLILNKFITSPNSPIIQNSLISIGFIGYIAATCGYIDANEVIGGVNNCIVKGATKTAQVAKDSLSYFSEKLLGNILKVVREITPRIEETYSITSLSENASSNASLNTITFLDKDEFERDGISAYFEKLKESLQERVNAVKNEVNNLDIVLQDIYKEQIIDGIEVGEQTIADAVSDGGGFELIPRHSDSLTEITDYDDLNPSQGFGTGPQSSQPDEYSQVEIGGRKRKSSKRKSGKKTKKGKKPKKARKTQKGKKVRKTMKK